MEEATQIQNEEGYNLFKIQAKADAVPGQHDESVTLRQRWEIRNQDFNDQMTKRLLEAFQKAQTVPIPITLEDGTAFNVAWSVTDSRSSGIGGIFFDLAWEQETDSARTLTGGDRQATPEAGHSQIGI